LRSPRRRGRWSTGAAWLSEQGAEIASGPQDHDYIPGYYAAFFADPAGIRLEIVHRSEDLDLAAAVRALAERLAALEARLT
jgi:hypothetical protein